VISEKNITLLLDSTLYSAKMQSDTIEEVWVRCDKTEHLYRIKASIFCDCTGDSRLALEAGAEYRIGRESLDEFGETLAVHAADKRTQGSSILFTTRKHDYVIPYKPPKWARKVTENDLKYRGVGKSWEYGYWWIELGGMYDTIRDNERLRFELLSVVLGVWDHIKNSGNYPDSKNWALETVGMIPGKRESRRVVGDHIVTQNDLTGDWRTFEDAIAIGGWAMDDHPPEGFDAPELRPYLSIKLKEPYNIPFAALYSKNVRNLMMAGRNISCSHVGFSSARVMGTTSVVGQAAGTAAALCIKHNILPRELRQTKIRTKELQQILLRDDQSIRDIKNEDPADLARTASVSASASTSETRPENILSGVTRDLPDEWKNRWAAPLDDNTWVQLSWNIPQTLSHIQIAFDSGFERQLTLTASDGHNSKIIRAAQPETVKDYSVQIQNDKKEWITVALVSGNYQRLQRHYFNSVKTTAVRLNITATNGAPEARIYEVRCYA